MHFVDSPFIGRIMTCSGYIFFLYYTPPRCRWSALMPLLLRCVRSHLSFSFCSLCSVCSFFARRKNKTIYALLVFRFFYYHAQLNKLVEPNKSALAETNTRTKDEIERDTMVAIRLGHITFRQG